MCSQKTPDFLPEWDLARVGRVRAVVYPGALVVQAPLAYGRRLLIGIIHIYEPEQVDEIIMGNVVSAGLGQNPARQAGLRGGLHSRVAALTIN